MGRRLQPRITVFCKTCDTPFKSLPSWNRKFCSPECAYLSKDRVAHIVKKDRPLSICRHCLTEFKTHTRSGLGIFCSQQCARTYNGKIVIINNRRFCGNTFKYGWHEIGGVRIFFRSSWEVDFAKLLQSRLESGFIDLWEYEPDSFQIGESTYTPDFKIVSADGSHQYIEIKGWLRDKDAEKITNFWMLYPDEKLILITDRPGDNLWEEKKK